MMRLRTKANCLKEVFSLRTLLKDPAAFLVLSAASVVLGFMTADLELYDTIYTGLEDLLNAPLVGGAILIVLCSIMLLFVGVRLSTRYAIKGQAYAASLLLFAGFFLTAMAGVWGRTAVELRASQTSNSSEGEIVDPQMTDPSGDEVGHSHTGERAPLATAILVGLSLSLVNSLFRINIGPYSNVDYAKYIDHRDSMISSLLATASMNDDATSREAKLASFESFCSGLKETIDELDSCAQKEKAAYSGFLRSRLKDPLDVVYQYYSRDFVRGHPNEVRRLLSQPNALVPDGALETYQAFQTYLNRNRSCYGRGS